MRVSRRKTTTTAFSLFLMLAMVVSLTIIPLVNAQDYTIYISSQTVAVVDDTISIRLEVRPAGSSSRIRHAWFDVQLAVMDPSSTEWTYFGPYDSGDNGRLDQLFTVTETGTYQFMWIVPPQQELPSNPEDPDGLWYSNVFNTEVYTEEDFPTAHDPPWEVATFASIMAVPNPIGVGQYTHIYMWVDKVIFSAAIVNDIRMHDYKLTITKPDNTTEIHEWPIVHDTTSNQGYNYAPAEAGTYTLKFEYPGQTYEWFNSNYGDIYLPSSAETTLVVQEEPVPNLPDSYPLPKEYWTRPIYGENPGWWTISSDWLGTGSPQTSQYFRYIADGVGPQTPHVMWTKPLQDGGVVGGDNFEIKGDTYFEGSAYISRYRNPIIVAGKLYYKPPIGFSSSSGGPMTCVDIRTGELIWSRDDVPSLDFAYIYDTQQPNQHGVQQPVLCTRNFGECYDAYTGEHMYDVEHVPSGETVFGPNGEILKICFINEGTRANPDYYLAQWNSTKMHFAGGLTPSQSGTYDASDPDNFDWSVPIPWRNTMTSSPSQLHAWYNDVLICRNGTLPGVGSFGRNEYSGDPYTYCAVNLNPDEGERGRVLWWNTVDAPPGQISIIDGVGDPTTRVFTESYRETSQWVGYSMTSGKKLWGPSERQAPLDYYGYFYPGLSEGQRTAPGKLLSAGMAGIIYCYNMTTGDILWTYGNGGEGNSTNSGFQVPGPYPTFIYAIANGIVYTMDTEHTIQTPIYKGSVTRAINLTDGTEIWTLSSYTGGGVSAAAVADGFATWFNGYDNQIYVVGRGSSATTVTIQSDIITHGDSVVVKGMVTDTSAGTQQNEQAARFPNGVPVISDADMTDWMGYIYQQKPLPTEATGVEVVISVLDPNINCYEVARTTSDTSGYFGCTFEPEVPGFYKVIATFEGSEGYWGSSAETFLNVEDAPQPTPVPTPVPQEPVGTYFTVSTVLIIAAIAIVAFLLLRRR
jgi:hypothetical protein